MERRQFIAGSAIAALSVSALPIAVAATNADRTQWEAALTKYRGIVEQQVAANDHWDRTHAAWEAGRPSMDGIHWKHFWPDGQHKAGRQNIARVIDLDKRWQQYLEGEGKWWFSPTPEKAKAEYRAALDSVQAFRDAEAKHDHDSGYEAANDRSDKLSDSESEASSALMEMPAPDLAALRWKLDYLTEEARHPEGSLGCYSHRFVSQTLADIARLLPEAK